ncbi:PQQ-binding-like beta-propeller repeat protein [Haloterrigena sp. SYSU A121-1]|uniref:PQQ-binding-like beta-propeller repeat protein n=1 Tax=Haloterrigena gelatinilytica TaxID=2741724 RepID=A0A8J8GND6_9EURY|nr:PQQ-binding-like beta-propeller repeat protein [Haloterrigena gelatinilytica]NUB93323.1 PQQ-binding-like beta-propeller repeat protein [Haloterrigena gelatinilytica]
MPSRRRLLAGVGLGAVGIAGGASVLGDGLRTSIGVASAADSAEVDWPMARYDAAGTGFNPDTSGPKDDPRIAWEGTFDRTGGFGMGPPILADGTVYASTDELVAFDAATGDVRFSYGDAHRFSSPAHVPSSIYRTETLAVATPGGIVGLNAGGGLKLFGRRFGDERWEVSAGESGFDFFGSTEVPPPVTVDETVYGVVPETSDVVALEADSGRERWRRTVEYSDIASEALRRPAVRDGTVFVTAWPHQLRAFDAETGDEEWRDELDEQTVLAPTATDDAVVVPTRSGVTTYEADGSDVRWKRDLEGNATEGAAAVADGTVFLADSNQSLHALDLETGDEEWSVSFATPTTPVVADGVVYVTNGAEIIAFDAETGDELFAYESEWTFSPPAVGDGVLYAVDGDRLLALEGSA